MYGAVSFLSGDYITKLRFDIVRLHFVMVLCKFLHLTNPVRLSDINTTVKDSPDTAAFFTGSDSMILCTVEILNLIL